MAGSAGLRLARGIEIRVLAHLNVGLGPLPLDVFKHPPLAPVSRLDSLLGPLECGQSPFWIAIEPPA